MNEDFLIATCPPVDREGSRVVNPQSGVKVNEQHYWHTDFRSHQFSGKKCLVRLDPWDASSVYVWLKDRWVQARCRNLMGLGQLTEFERIALTKEFEIKFGSVSNDSRRPQRLHEYLKTFTPSGALAIAFEREAENKSLYNELNLSSVVPHETLHRLFLTDPIRPIEAINHLSDTSETLPTSEKTSASTPDDIQKFDRF